MCRSMTTQNNSLIVMSVQDIVWQTEDSSQEFLPKDVWSSKLSLDIAIPGSFKAATGRIFEG